VSEKELWDQSIQCRLLIHVGAYYSTYCRENKECCAISVIIGVSRSRTVGWIDNRELNIKDKRHPVYNKDITKNNEVESTIGSIKTHAIVLL
jgi:hypothetical protein